ncbi:winged helix-turn-helix domain-containing protein [Haladaptatus sp. DYF46]|uniref:winged helix-turn-helix domain-containing protein n=1 Tax=Haladaptatus sp. DYF46 TaxID=2886041 RepID=UPI001E6428A6|nr:winged helix-turn-helix domain-containing protein [Haladaptatus sp. DYF46]
MQQSASTPDDTDDPKTRPPADVLSELPPSAKLVAKVFEYNDDSLTPAELADETLLPARTVRYALTRLEDNDLINVGFSFADVRKRCYSLTYE